MAIGPIEMQGQILRTGDYSAIKHQEDAKGEVAQSNIQQTRETEQLRQHSRVTGSQESGKSRNDRSASDKGSNEYQGDGGARRREAREAKAADGKVLIKAVKRSEDSK